MKIIYQIGDLLECSESVIVHGCNASGVAYNSGVAGQVRSRFPFAYEVYRNSPPEDLTLGNILWAIDTESSRIIGNAITQQDYGRSGKQYVNYDAIRTVVEGINRFVLAWKKSSSYMPNIVIDRVAMPEIGAGLGGGDWSVISEIIESGSLAFQPVVYRLK